MTILEGDAEDLPFEADSFDRYVSAGSIECERGWGGSNVLLAAIWWTSRLWGRVQRAQGHGETVSRPPLRS